MKLFNKYLFSLLALLFQIGCDLNEEKNSNLCLKKKFLGLKKFIFVHKKI